MRGRASLMNCHLSIYIEECWACLLQSSFDAGNSKKIVVGRYQNKSASRWWKQGFLKRSLKCRREEPVVWHWCAEKMYLKDRRGRYWMHAENHISPLLSVWKTQWSQVWFHVLNSVLAATDSEGNCTASNIYAKTNSIGMRIVATEYAMMFVFCRWIQTKKWAQWQEQLALYSIAAVLLNPVDRA